MAYFETEISFTSTERTYISDITDSVNDVIAETRTRSGLVVVTSLHTTLGLQINEGREPNLLMDIVDIARNLVPEDKNGSWVRGRQEYPFPTAAYRHYCGDNPELEDGEVEDDNNAPRHVRNMLLGYPNLERLYRDGRLILGRFQRFLVMEHDGREDPIRERRIHVLVNSFEEEVKRLNLRRLAPNAGYQNSGKISIYE